MQTQLTKWGNSLAVRIPRQALEQARLKEGDRLELSVDPAGSLSLRPARRTINLSELVEAITPDNLHNETEWGSAVGNEQL